MAAIVKESISQQIYEDLAIRIRRREILPGTRLVVNTLRDEYNVSSTPIRDALSLLYRYGFVENLGNSRYAVITITRKLVNDLLDTYGHIGAMGIQLSFANDKNFTYRHLQELSEAFFNCGERNTARSFRLYADFLNAFVDYTGNDCIARMADPLLGIFAVAFGEYTDVFEHEGAIQVCRDMLRAYETDDMDLAIRTYFRVADCYRAYARTHIFGEE